MAALPDDFVTRLSERAAEAEDLRRLPEATIADFRASGLAKLLLPARYGGEQAPFSAILDPVRRMAHGCASSAWTLGFYILHNWMLALFDERAQDEVFADGPVLCPAPLAPTGRGVPVDGGVRLSGRWSWATGVMAADWVMVGALCGTGAAGPATSGNGAAGPATSGNGAAGPATSGSDDGMYPALALLPADQVRVEDVWHTAGMRATGSNDVVVDDVVVPEHRLVKVTDIYAGTAPGAALHGAATYRWPMVPALALVASMPALGAAEHVADVFAARLGERMLAYSGVPQKQQPAAQIRLGDARVRLKALDGLLTETVATLEAMVADGQHIPRAARAKARVAAAHIVHESRSVIADLLESSGASAQFLDSPLQRAKRDVDVISGHVVFDYDTSRELAGALEIGVPISPIAMV